ncbi:MAG: hypothetical protein ACOYVG_07265 [Bacteroidota bacterium]
MIAEIENPQMSLIDLSSIEDKVKDNTATSTEYESLDKYLSFLGVENYILNALNKSLIRSYEEFITQRKNSNNSDINLLVGTVLGVISILKKHITGKL